MPEAPIVFPDEIAKFPWRSPEGADCQLTRTASRSCEPASNTPEPTKGSNRYPRVPHHLKTMRVACGRLRYILGYRGTTYGGPRTCQLLNLFEYRPLAHGSRGFLE